MFDNELEQTIAFLKTKLPDYLRSQGINPAAKFACINPKDSDHLPSMSFAPKTLTVRCFNCNAEYDIFDIIGIQYNLSDFNSQFKKAHELFIGPVSSKLTEALNNRFPQEPTIPQFEFANDFDEQESEEDEADVNKTNNPHFSKHFSHGLFAESKIGSQNISFGSVNNDRNVTLGKGRFSFSSYPRANNNNYNNGTVMFSQKIDNPHCDFSEYFNQCAINRANTDYFKNRGIPDDIVRRFNLGYDDHCMVGIDQIGNKIFWHAAIIPYGNHGYRIRNTDPKSKERFRGKGVCDIFNSKALERPGKIFITEGEFDALSLEALGYSALALGGVGNVNQLLDMIRSIKVEHVFYICLDNDKSGQEASRILASTLYQLQIPYKDVNISFPYKDPNEAFCKDKEAFISKLNNLDNLLKLKILEPFENEPNASYINAPEDLSNLVLSHNLYTFCGKATTLRLLLANIINTNLCSILYIANTAQYRNLQTLIDTSDSINELKSQFLKISGINEIEEIKEALSICVLQGTLTQIIIIDGLTFNEEMSLKTARILSKFAKSLKLPIIFLGNTNVSEKIESLSLQNIDISLTADGDFKCSTVNDIGHPISFIKYARI